MGPTLERLPCETFYEIPRESARPARKFKFVFGDKDMGENSLDKSQINALYNRLFKMNVYEPLNALGFNKLKSSGMFRVIDKQILQAFVFEKCHYGTNEVEVTMIIHPVFQDMEHLILEPGICLGDLIEERKYKTGQYSFSYKNESIAEKNFKIINSLILEKAIPIFDNYKTIEKLITIYEDRSNDFKPPRTKMWTSYVLALLYGKNKDYEKARANFKDAANEAKVTFAWYLSNLIHKREVFCQDKQKEKYNKYLLESIDDLYKMDFPDDEKWAIKLAKKWKELYESKDNKKIDELLEDNMKFTYEKLGLNKSKS